MSSARAGWYVDPSTGTNLRFWSGSTWTDEVAPLPIEPAHSGPVDLFGAAVTAAESATTAAEVPATVAAVDAPGHGQAEIEPEPVDNEPDPEPGGAEPEPAEAATAPAERAAEPEPAGDDPVGAAALPIPYLDPEVEQTQLTRRELRARRGADPAPDDTPKHLPPMTPPAAVSNHVAPEPVEAVEISAQEPLAPVEAQTDTDDDPVARRRRVVRLSVLLGILAVTSTVAVLTAGTL